MESKKVHDEKTQAEVADAFRKGPEGLPAEKLSELFPAPTEAELAATAAKPKKSSKKDDE